jgi:cytoskeletal protein CcmA (bactofilin family)
MSAPILQFKRGNLNNLNFGLRSGEPAFTLDTFDLFVGINSVFEDNKFFGSHRYWEREDGTTSLRLRLVDNTGNVANSIHLKSPDAHTGITTYTFPSTPVAGEFLQVDANGNLSWASEFGEINVDELFAGDATFGGNVAFTTTTESTDPTTGGVVVTAGLGVGGNVNIGGDLGVTGIGTFGGAVTIYDDTQSDDKDTGALILEGGLGVEKNVNLGGDLGVTGSATINSTTDTDGNATTGALVVDGGVGIAKSVYIGTDLTVENHLFVGGTSEFVGVVTFRGGVINIGDEDTDDINVGGEFISSLTPNTDDLHDLGSVSQRWRTLNVVNVNTTDISASGISTFTGLVDANGGLDVTGQTTLNDNLTVAGVSTFTGAIDVNGGADISSGLNVTGGSTLDNLNVTGVSTFTGTLNSSTLIAATNLTASGISTFNTLEVTENTTLGDGSGDSLIINATSTFNSPATFLGTLTGTISTATRATLVDTTETGTDAEFYPTFVSASVSTESQTVRTDAGISYNPDSNTLTVPNIKTENLKHSNGTQSVAIDSSGNVGLSSNLTVAGNLFVNGSTTSVNTETLKVKDSLIDLGKIDNGSGQLVPPASDLNIDVGVLLNYFDTEARKAAVYWDDSVSRIAVASRVTEAASVLTASAYAALEVGGLWVNNTCTGGASEIISCFGGTELEVRNVLIDAGTF